MLTALKTNIIFQTLAFYGNGKHVSTVDLQKYMLKKNKTKQNK